MYGHVHSHVHSHGHVHIMCGGILHRLEGTKVPRGNNIYIPPMLLTNRGQWGGTSL